MLKQILSKIPRKKAISSNGGHLDPPDPTTATRIDGAHMMKRNSSAMVFPSGTLSGIEPLVPFKDVPSSEKQNLFVSKVSLCCVTFDFSDIFKNTGEKDVKRRTLLELLEFVSTVPPYFKFSEPAIFATCRMCALNLFRVFPPSYRSSSGTEAEDGDDPTFDPAWPHLQLVYDLLLKFINSQSLEAKSAKKYIDHCFILRLLDLFDSEDPRERECLKAVLHRIYGKFMVHRPFIRKSISNIMYRFVFETEKHNGIAELLEILGSIISGFALPLKEEHKFLLMRVLIPLHKPKCMGLYFQQLSYCVTQFIEKEAKLAVVVIGGMLKYWPVTNSQKEVLLLGEMEEILSAITMVEFQKVMVAVFWRISKCITSSHFQVAERALFLWNNDQIVNLIAHNRHAILPIVFQALEKNLYGHWNQAVLNLTLNVRKIFAEMDDALFQSCIDQHRDHQHKLTTAAQRRIEDWRRLEIAANSKPVSGRFAILVGSTTTTIAC